MSDKRWEWVLQGLGEIADHLQKEDNEELELKTRRGIEYILRRGGDYIIDDTTRNDVVLLIKSALTKPNKSTPEDSISPELLADLIIEDVLGLYRGNT